MARYSVNNYTVETLLSNIKSGSIAIPEMQRPFVWDSSKVRDLVDSLYKGFPVGYIIVWQNPDVKLKDGTKSSGKKVLIDGQQRITAMAAAIVGQEVLDDHYKWKRMLISQMLPLTVLMIPMYYMENRMGLIDTRFGLAMAHLVICMPLVTWMTRGYFKSIPKEMEEAAMVDGCNTVQTLWHIILPLLKPALAATGIYAFVSSWNEFALANVLTRSMSSRTVPIALNEFSSFFKVDWGQTMAAAALITLPVVIVFMLIQKQFVAGLASGAVKG